MEKNQKVRIMAKSCHAITPSMMRMKISVIKVANMMMKRSEASITNLHKSLSISIITMKPMWIIMTVIMSMKNCIPRHFSLPPLRICIWIRR